MFLFLPSSPGCSLSSIEHVWKKGAIVGTRAWLWPAPRNNHDLLKVLLTTPSTEDRNGSYAGALGKPPIAQAGQQTTKAETIKKPLPHKGFLGTQRKFPFVQVSRIIHRCYQKLGTNNEGTKDPLGLNRPVVVV